MLKKHPTNIDALTPADKALIKKIEILTQSVERVYPGTKGLIWRSFLQGIFVGLGTTIGLAIVLSVAALAIAQLKLIPGLDRLIENSKLETIVDRTPKK